MNYRISDPKNIMNMFTNIEAKKYLHKKGYFTNDIEDFQTLNDIEFSELKHIEDDSIYPYESETTTYKFFLPEEFTTYEKADLKYRPYTLSEFKLFCLDVSDTWVRLRKKGTNHVFQYRYNGFVECNEYGDTTTFIILGDITFRFEGLLEEYEVWINGEWKPCGMETTGALQEEMSKNWDK